MGKNIVLLSDGTGNSAAKLFKTDVWRLYQALDLRPGSNQIAYYDDGVGTSSFRPLAMLGGALGFGLKRNVKDLYTFLCQNYELGDHIYGFGFSRGAFTMRVLAGMIATQGVIPGRTMLPEELRVAVDQAWKDDRADYKTHWSRWRNHETATALNPTVPPGRQDVKIEFLGLWDTVDAYGLPSDELKRGLDYWLLGLSFPDQDLSPIVRRACHALALDDERQTFHPVLWNERFEEALAQQDKTRAGRLQQVWFMGMHSNVGGGYAKDELAHVSLNWMVQQAQASKLVFHQAALEQFERAANAHTDMADSRAGVGAFYRYGPRRLSVLGNDPYNKVWIDRPKIHHSVLDRIRAQAVTYLPLVIPAEYEIVGPQGKPIANTYENAKQAQARVYELEWAWDLVWWRKIAYYVTLAITAMLVFYPWMPWVSGASGCTGNWCFLEPLLVAVYAVLPGWTELWIGAFRANIGMFFLLSLGLIAGIAWGKTLERRMTTFAGEAWAHVTGHAVTKPLDYGPFSWIARQLRNARWLVGAYRWLARHAVPFVFFLVTVALLVLAGNRLLFDIGEAIGFTCKRTAEELLLTPAAAPMTVARQFETRNPCFGTGVMLVKGSTYRLTFKIEQPWHDGTHPATPAGFTGAEAGQMFVLATPLRRSWRSNWFEPIARVGSFGRDRYHLQLPRTGVTDTPLYAFETIYARTSGELFLFVNDAVLGVPWRWSYFYKSNNQGSAQVTITRIEEAVPQRGGQKLE